MRDIILIMISRYFQNLLNDKTASAIRKMFEEGKILKQKYGEENVYDFSLGNPDLDPPQKVLDAIKEVALEERKGVHGYMSNAGYDEAREAMAKKESAQQNVSVDSSCVVMTVGAASAISAAIKALTMPGEEVIVPSPFFAEYTHYVHNHGGTLVPVSTKGDFSLDIDAIKSRLSPKTVAVIINSPNNPTGKIYTKDEIASLCKALKDFGEKNGSRYPYLICDEPYRDIVYDGLEVPPVFPEYPYSVIVTSFAKNLSIPGERVGYICANPLNPEKSDFIAAATMAFRISGCVNAPAFFQRVIAKSWDAQADFSSYRRRRDLLMDVLDNAGLEYCKPQGAFYIFCKVPPQWNDDDSAFVDALAEQHILCAPGAGFGKKGWFRIAYCVGEKTIINSREAFCKAARSKL